MNAHTLLSKLEPLIPDRVNSWRKAWPFLDDKTKSLLEKQVIATAYELLGDVNKKLLLSLPPSKKSQGAINVGTIVYDSDRWPAGISETELL